MKLSQNQMNKAAAIIAAHFNFNKLPGNAEVYWTIETLRDPSQKSERSDLLKGKLLAIGILI